MLRLRSQAIRRLGTPYTCPSCLGAPRTPLASGLQQSVAARQRIQHHSYSTSTPPAATVVNDSNLPEEPSPKSAPETETKSKRKRSKKHKLKKAASPSTEDTQRQLQVLQGALAALKNVLDQQNINVDSIKKPENRKASHKNIAAQKSESISEASEVQAGKPTGRQSENQTGEKAETQTGKQTGRPADIQAEKKAGKPSRKQAENQTTKPVENQPEKQTETQADTIKPKRQKSRNKRPVPDDQEQPDQQEADKSKADFKLHPRPFSRSSKPAGAKQEHYSKEHPPKKSHPSKLSKHIRGLLVAENLKSRDGPKHKPGKKVSTEIGSEEPISQTVFDRKTPLQISKLDPEGLELVPIEKPQPPVAAIAHGLERTLFNPGVYHLQDPRSKVYNFDPYLSNIMPIKEFDFQALQQYVTSSKDTALIDVARENNKKYTGSTSSMTTMLSHFHYLLSSWREINSEMMSRDFEVPSQQFTRLLRAPAATFLHWKDGVYAIDADKEFDSANILSMLGKSMEKLLTLPVEEYEKYRRGNSHQISEEERNAAEAYHYTGLGDFMMRSQLDAYDPRVPGTGMFDIKTRAVISIRMDAKGFQKGLGYEIRHRQGNWESYEREYHDMIRAAFLKYSLQVRMGRMDGIFVAYHNTQRIFGFQYIPLEEMDLALHGTSDLTIGDKEFKLSIALLNELLNRAAEKFPEKSLRLFVETRTSTTTPFMYAFVKPVEPGEIEAVQNAGKASVEAFERELAGLQNSIDSESAVEAEGSPEEKAVGDEKEADASEVQEESEDTTASWDEIQMMVEGAMEDEELGVGAVRQAIEEALEESGLLEEQSPEEARGYVDALLDAVTGGSTQPPGTSAETTDCSEVGVDSPTDTSTPPVSENTGLESSENNDHQASTRDIGSVVKSESSDTSVQTTDQSQTSDVATVSSEAKLVQEETRCSEEGPEEDAELEEDDAQDDSGSSSNLFPLRNAIIRMTRRIDEKGPAEQQRDEAVSTKLQDFERILSKIISESREDENNANGSGPAEAPEAIEEVSANKSSPAAVADRTASASLDWSTTLAESEAESEELGPILGMVLTVRNKVNDKFVVRPEHLTKDDTWEVEYNIDELEAERAHRLFDMCRKRRAMAYDQSKRGALWNQMFEGALSKYSHKGREFRKQETERAKEQPVHILGEKEGKSYEEVFGTGK